MSDLIINKIIIHELVKEQHNKIEKNNYGQTILDSSDEIVRQLIHSIIGIYGRKNNAAQYGIFMSGPEKGLFPDQFSNYSKLSTPSDNEFIELTKVAMNELYRKAQGRGGASGGYVLFSDYVNSQGRFFVIVMIKKKSGITLSDDLKPLELIELDLSRIHQAARINYSKYSGYIATTNSRLKDDLNYLSFISPKLNQATAGYFITAIGCAEGAASAQATKNLIDESVKFFKMKDELKDSAGEFKEKLVEYLDQKMLSGESVKLSHVEAIARNYMPSDEQDEADNLANEFISHLNDEPISVPVEFR